jgi:hypothetical protein
MSKPFTTKELESFRASVADTTDDPHLVRRYSGLVLPYPLKQPWFAAHQILRMVPEPNGTCLYIAQNPAIEKVMVLSGRLDNWKELVLAEPPKGLDETSVVAFAQDCDQWTTDFGQLVMPVSTFKDIEWTPIRPGDTDRMRDLEGKVGATLHAPKVESIPGGYKVVRFVVYQLKLLRRELDIEASGVLRGRADTALAENLPISLDPHS